MQDNHTHERALALLEKLMALRPTFSRHKSVLVSVDHAIGNVFKAQNHDEIGNYIPKIEKLVGFVQEMNKLGVRTTSIGLPPPDLQVSEAMPQYQEVNAKYEKLRDVRHQLTMLGIPTIDVENAMADILMKHGAALAFQVLEEPAIVKKQSPSADSKSEPSKHVPGQSAGLDYTIPLYKTETASTMKRSTSTDDVGDANTEDVSKGEANRTKRRKASLDVWLPSFSYWSSKGKYSTETWRVPVKEIATEGLRIVSKGSDRSLMLYSTTKTSSIAVAFNDECLSTRYPCLELMPFEIYTIKRNSLKTKKDLKARLIKTNTLMKPCSFDIIFPSNEDCEAFVERIPSFRRLDSSSPPSDVMERLFENSLWLEEKTKIFGRAAKTRFMEIVELE